MRAADSKPTSNSVKVNDDPRWARVLARDASADGRFVYSVRTTGVYCRPSCPSRRARYEHVAFHASAADAERAGFRPCKRCRPDQSADMNRHVELVARLCRRIESAEEPPALAQLAREAGLSRYHLHRVFRTITGLTPKAYADAHRARRVRERLGANASVTGALYDAGFRSANGFYARSEEMLGMTPTHYRAGGAGLDIRFATAACALGVVLVARTERGLCAIQLGDDASTLQVALRRRFPRARVVAADEVLARDLAAVVQLIDHPRRRFDLPLDVIGTAFQQRVWQALRAISPGATLSYGELARRLGNPKSVRAVAQACGANPLAIVIPCHRVVGANGALTGYRWGVERKRKLIDLERGEVSADGHLRPRARKR